MKESYLLETKCGKVRIGTIGETFYLKKTIQGKQREISLRTSNRTQAESTARNIMELSQKFPIEDVLIRAFGGVAKKTANPSEMTVEDYILKYRQYCLESEKAPSEKTIKNAIGYLRLIANKTDSVTLKDLEKITPEIMAKHYKNPISRNSAIRQAKSIFKDSVLKWLHRLKIDVENPFRFYELNKTKISPYVPLTPEIRLKLEKEIKKQPDNIQLLFLLAYKAGLRRAESDKIRFSSLTKSEKGGVIQIKEEIDFVPKSRQSRIINISPEIYKEILKLRGKSDSEFLVPSIAIQRKGRKNKHGSYRLENEFDSIIAFLKPFKVDYHDLRKEFGSRVASKFGLFHAMSILGHSDYKTTLAYYSSLVENPVME